jgi:hypothetical protein
MRMREEIRARMRREAERAHYDRINAKHPIENQFSGLTREQHEARLRLMDEQRRRDFAHLDEVNSRPIPGAAARSLTPTRADGAGGPTGFVIKR